MHRPLDPAIAATRRRGPFVLIVLLAGTLASSPALSQAGAAPARAVPASGAAAAALAPSRYLPDRFAGRAGKYYRAIWGVDSLATRVVESGQVIRFSYRVVDTGKARVLNDKQYQPALVAPRAGVSLVVPAMENIGQLRQTNTPEAGTVYWMAFSNKGRLVKRGDRVNVVIGQFHADGLVVD